jgi:hypothetical protein
MSDKISVIEITGVSPLLMNRYPLDPIEALDKKPKEVQAENAAYRDESGYLYIPGPNIQRALVGGAAYSKGKGRASLQKPVAASVMVQEAVVTLDRKEYTIDSRRVVNPSTKGAIVRHRPCIDNWKVQFSVLWDDDLITEEQLQRVVEDTGKRVGLLDFRPANKGPFGRFRITKFSSE